MKISVLVSTAAVVLHSLAIGQQIDTKEPKLRTATVRGLGQVTTSPDQVRLSVQVTSRASSATEAMTQTSTKTRELLNILKGLGVETKDIQTTRVTVSPVLDYQRNVQPPPIVGYIGTNEFVVVFKGMIMDRVGEFMDKAVKAGASSFGGLVYENSKQRELERDALRRAVADAQARAGALAKELGVTVGKVISVSEMVGGPIPLQRGTMAMEAASVPAPVMSGELTITAQVDVVFELMP